MAMRLGIQKPSGAGNLMWAMTRWVHVQSMAPPLVGSIQPKLASPSTVLPEPGSDNVGGFRFGGLFPPNGSMELMAVPKKKVSRHKRGIRNGPKALKPTPVIIRCRSCGRVKLPHFYCCSGERENTGEQSK